MHLAGLMVRFAALPGPVRSGIWMSVSAITYVVSIAIGRYLAPSIEVFQIAFLRNAFAIPVSYTHLTLPTIYSV